MAWEGKIGLDVGKMAVAVRFCDFDVGAFVLERVVVHDLRDFGRSRLVDSFAGLLEISPRHAIHLISASC